jgi:hypothetical protein
VPSFDDEGRNYPKGAFPPRHDPDSNPTNGVTRLPGFNLNGKPGIARIALKKGRFLRRIAPTGRFRVGNRLNLSRNSFLISVSQKVRWRLSFERVHDDQTEKDHSRNRTA